MNKFKYGSIITPISSNYLIRLTHVYKLYIGNNQFILLDLDASSNKYTLISYKCYLVTDIFCEDI